MKRTAGPTQPRLTRINSGRKTRDRQNRLSLSDWKLIWPNENLVTKIVGNGSPAIDAQSQCVNLNNWREDNSVGSTPQFHADPLSLTHQLNTMTTPSVQHQKLPSSTPTSSQFHTENPSVKHEKTLSSTPKTSQGVLNGGVFGVELRSFWVGTRGRQKNPNPNPRFRKNESQSKSQKFSNSIPVPIPKFSKFNLNPNPTPKNSTKSQTMPRNSWDPNPKNILMKYTYSIPWFGTDGFLVLNWRVWNWGVFGVKVSDFGGWKEWPFCVELRGEGVKLRGTPQRETLRNKR